MQLIVESSQDKLDILYDELIKNDFAATMCKKDKNTLTITLYDYQLNMAMSCIQAIFSNDKNRCEHYPAKIVYPYATVYIHNEIENITKP